MIKLETLTANLNYNHQLKAPARSELGPAQSQLVLLYFWWFGIHWWCVEIFDLINMLRDNWGVGSTIVRVGLMR